MKKRILAILIAAVMAVTLVPALSFAEGDNGSLPGQDQNVNEQQNGEQSDQEGAVKDELQDKDQQQNYQEQQNESKEEQLPSKVTLSYGSKVQKKQGGTITGIPAGQTSATVELLYGETREFAITPNKGFSISKVIVNGEDKGIVRKVTLTGNGEDQSIFVQFRKGSLFIMLDAGHAGHYNRGIIRKYWESKMTWKLTRYLKKELESYGIVCGMTKKSLNHDPGIFDRGAKAKGYDLFISIHSNYSDSSATDYPLAIVSSKYKKKLYKKAQPIGKKLAKTIRKTMKTKQSYMVWVKRQSDGRDWYGVIRGSASVNVPGIILEHSFHSNRSKCKWLLKNKNLKKMARAEAKTIAEHYGYSK